MEKVKFDLFRISWVMVAISLFASLVYYYINFILLDAVIMFIYVSLVSLVIFLSVFHSLNKNLNKGVYISHSGVQVRSDKLDIFYPWESLTVRVIFKIPFLCKILEFSLKENNENKVKYELMYFNTQSFKVLYSKYKPRDMKEKEIIDLN